MHGHLMWINWSALTPDNRTAISAGPEDAILVWDVPTGRLRRRLEGHNNAVVALQLRVSCPSSHAMIINRV